MTIKRFLSLLVSILLLAGGLLSGRSVRADEPVVITELSFLVGKLHCGDTVTEEGPLPEVTLRAWAEESELSDAVTLTLNHWAAEFRGESFTPFAGSVDGDSDYIAFLEIKAQNGYVFDEEVELTDADPIGWFKTVVFEEARIVLAVYEGAEHVIDPEHYVCEPATCVSTGMEDYVCAVCGGMILSFLQVDPEAHDFGEWQILKEATTMETGKRTRSCKLCGKEETEEIPKKDADIYEPETSWTTPSVVAWRADENAVQIAASERRPAVQIVWVDAALRIYERNGGLLSGSIGNFAEATSKNVTPAFCFQNETEARALLDWLRKSGLQDCYLVSAPQNQEHIKTIIAYTHVKGILDFTSAQEAGRSDLEYMAQLVNDANAQVVLLSPECATRSNIEILQELGVSVWVKTPAEFRTLLTLYTNGVDGVLTDDYETALLAEEVFQDDAQTVLGASDIIRMWKGSEEQSGEIPDYVVEILAEDLVTASKEDSPKPQGRTRAGELLTLNTAELVTADQDPEGTELLAMWRYRTEYTAGEEEPGSYYTYSNPFTVKIEIPPTDAPTEPPTEPPTEAPETETEPVEEEKGTDVWTVLLWILFGLAAAAFLSAITMIVIKMIKGQREKTQ